MVEPCPWCRYNGAEPGECACETEDFYLKCEYRTLPFEKKAIVSQVAKEWEEMTRMQKVVLDRSTPDEEKRRLIVSVMDKGAAVQVMMKVLEEEFGMRRGEIIRACGIERPSAVESMRLMMKMQKLKAARGRA